MSEIHKAFVKAQHHFAPALKTSTNPHFRSQYADLSACVEAVIDALNNAGIGLMQHTHECTNGVIVETVFVHESGETLSCGKLHVPAAKNDAQGYGSALTYARRYSLMAACGIAPEDDDGNAASKAPKGSAKRVTQEAMDTLSPEEQLFVSGVAEEVKTLIDTDPKTVIAKLSSLDNEEKLAVWSLLDAPTRRKVKEATT